MERTNKKRIPKWVRVTAIVLCAVLVLAFLPFIVSEGLEKVAKEMDSTARYAGGYKVSKYIGKPTIEGAVYVGRRTIEYGENEVVCDYYFAKKWYNTVMYEVPFGEFFDYRLVCAKLDANGNIETLSLEYMDNDLLDKAFDVLVDRKSEIRAGSITFWARYWWIWLV